MSERKVKEAFQKFGEVQNIDYLPSQSLAVCVTYYDVRAACWAMQALGGPRYCQPGKATGDRCVHLPGDFHIDESDAPGISNVTTGDGEGYTVEFFDVRDAERVRSAAREQKDQELEPPPGLEHLAAPPGLKPKAKKNKMNKMTPVGASLKDVTNVHPDARPSSAVAVFLLGLPNMLCTDAFFEATLQQAGFQKEAGNKNEEPKLVAFKTKPGKPCGEAVVWLQSEEDAQLCMAHFQGRKWDVSSGKAVQAWVVHDIPFTDPWSSRKRCDTGFSTVSTDVGGPSDDDPLP